MEEEDRKDIPEDDELCRFKDANTGSSKAEGECDQAKRSNNRSK